MVVINLVKVNALCNLPFHVFANMVKILPVLKQLAELNTSWCGDLMNNKPIGIMAFALVYIGNMPPQAQNAGFLGISSQNQV